MQGETDAYSLRCLSALEMERVLRRQEIREHSMPRLEMTALLSELLAGVNNLHLLEPAIAYELHPITEVRHDQVCLEKGTVLYGRLLPSLLSSAKELATVVCTIGSRLEEKVTYYFGNKEPLRGLLLDGIGSVAVDNLVQFVQSAIQRLGIFIKFPPQPFQ